MKITTIGADGANSVAVGTPILCRASGSGRLRAGKKSYWRLSHGLGQGAGRRFRLAGVKCGLNNVAIRQKISRYSRAVLRSGAVETLKIIMQEKYQAEVAAGHVTYGWINTPFRVELMHARFRHQQFAPHAHASWCLCAVIAGRKNIAIQSKPALLAQAGDIYLLHPDQAHAGGSVDDQLCEYVMVYISNEEWQEQCLRRSTPAQQKGIAPIHHPLLCRYISEFVCRVLEHQKQQLDWSKEWAQLLKFFFEEYELLSDTAPDSVRDSRLWRARDYLFKNWNRHVSLETLGNLSALSKFELTRRFCAAYGLPPHRYQMNLRIIQAKDQLLSGRPISDVATATGFSDQSHLGRVFKSALGITPGALSNQILYASAACPKNSTTSVASPCEDELQGEESGAV